MWYHLSQIKGLHYLGICCRQRPTVGRGRSDCVYIGTLTYINDQYAKYAPPGKYFLYAVDVTGLPVEKGTLPGEQMRCWGDIPEDHVSFIKEMVIK